MIYFVLVALATPSPPIDATMTAQGSFCIDACCPETAIPKLVFGPDDRFGEGITVVQNNSRLTCSGEFEATDVRIAGTNTTVADLISRVAVLEGQAVGRQTMHLAVLAVMEQIVMRSSSAQARTVHLLSFTITKACEETFGMFAITGIIIQVACLTVVKLHSTSRVYMHQDFVPTTQPSTGHTMVYKVRSCFTGS